MATLQNYISLRDGVSPVLEKMSRATSVVSDKLTKLSGGIRGVGDASESAAGKMKFFGSMFAANIVSDLFMRGLSSAQDMIRGTVALADEYAGIKARLALIAGSQNNVAALNEMIYESAQRARGGYMDMAKAVADLSTNAKDAFPDPRKTVEFVEGMQKLFVIGGAPKANQQAAMLQLQQALASGRLQGDEFRSITENAPILQDMIAKTMGITRGELKKLSTEGKITSDIIKRSILDNMDEINGRFEQMPKKWGDHFTDLKNYALKKLNPISDAIGNLANSAEVKELIADIKTGISGLVPIFAGVVGAVQWFIGVLVSGIRTVSSLIESRSLVMQGALIAVGMALGFSALMALRSAVQYGAAAVAMGLKTIATWAEVAASIAATYAQEGLNAALYACPITWIIGAVVLLIGVFYAVVAAVNHFAGTSISATGMIFGAFAALFAQIRNMVARVINVFIAFANFLGSVFQDPLNATANLFIDIWNGIGEYIEEAINGIIDMINKIPGMDERFEHVGFTVERREIRGGAAFHVDPIEMLDVANEYEFGYNVGASLGDWMKMPEGAETAVPDFDNIESNTADTADNTKKGADHAKRAADALDSTAEDLKFLREAAERETINKYTTATVHIDVGGVTAGDTGGNDFDGVMRRLNDVLIESVENGAEAVQR
ncbi:tape measure protein [Selenomonas artemidis]|uniref:tape measure protein n=1 Tax=Selenomonas artemidis TaxID=671224 RepID=UPI0028898ABA|nr:tape measure protein [Selenomonas artemidis]